MLSGKISDFFNIHGGNAGLTEEFIYKNQPVNEEDSISVYSSSTDKGTKFKNISKGAKIHSKNRDGDLVSKDIKMFSGEGIIIARNGKAGTARYINDECFTTNDHAYFVQLKSDYEDQINIYYFLQVQKNLAAESSSLSGGGNGTFNKTVYEQKKIEFPDLEIQNKLAAEFLYLQNLSDSLKDVIFEIDQVLNAKISF